jgi:formate dehydrogenase maturation protein FdhE
MVDFLRKMIRNMVYDAHFQCTNCNRTYKEYVMKGKTKKDYVKTKSCPNCLTISWIPI